MSRFMVAALVGTAIASLGAFTVLKQSADVTEAHLEQAPLQTPAPYAVKTIQSSKDRYLVQSHGTVCETSGGECSVSPLPINSFCTCGSAPGKITR